MLQECSNCRSQMTATQDGWSCAHCGTTKRHDYQSLFERKPESHTTESGTISPVIATPAQIPTIINHRASSQYRRRLAARQEQLEELELPSPLDPESALPAADPNQSAILSESNDNSESKSDPMTMPDPITAALHANLHHNSDQPVEEFIPNRPSAHVLNASIPAPHSHHSEHASTTIDPLTPTPTDETTLLQQAIADTHHEKIHSDAPRAPEQANAHAKAEALLAAAKEPEAGKKSRSRTWLLGGLSIFILASGLVGSWLLLKPSTKTASTSVSVLPSTTVNSSPSIAPSAAEMTKRDTQRKADLNAIAIGLEAYHASTGAYPVGNDIAVLYPLSKTEPPYISAINNDPLSTDKTNPIKYSYTSDGTSFTLSATLEMKSDRDIKNGLYIVKNN